MSASFTSSPWRIGDAGRTIFGPPNGTPSPKTIANVVSSRADARLIAAAPALLEALKQYQLALTSTRRDIRKDFSLCLADAAAAKALAIVAGH